MANLLILDASSSLCSVALITPEQTYAATEQQPRRHAQRLLPMVDDILQQAGVARKQLDGIAYGRGPGSFTGLRIAAAVTQGISFALELPVMGVSTLQTVAQQWLQEYAPDQKNCSVAVILNAHMGEVFWGCFQAEQGLMQAVSEERVGSPADCLASLSDFEGVIVGDGLLLEDVAVGVKALLSENPEVAATLLPEARFMLPLAEQGWKNDVFSDVDQHSPVYLRDSVAWKKLDEQPSLLKR